METRGLSAGVIFLYECYFHDLFFCYKKKELRYIGCSALKFLVSRGGFLLALLLLVVTCFFFKVLYIRFKSGDV